MFSKKIIPLLILGLFIITFTSCDSDDNDEIIIKQLDIVETAIGSNDLSILVQALQKADLVSALQADGPFTVFAPTNAAFQNLLDSNDSWNGLDDIPVDLLKTVLLYHVTSGVASSSGLSDGQVITMLNDGNISVDLSNGVQLSTIAEQMVTVTNADILVSNGIIHIIDEVMLPLPKEKDIVETAIGSNDLSILVQALQKADLVSALQADGPFTVFAPTNAAFQNLLDSNDSWNGLDDIPVDLLKTVLLYHVSSGVASSSDLSDGQVITMLNDGNISVDLSNAVQLSTIAEQMVTVTNADILVSNGIIHIIDEVMLPLPKEKDIVETAIGSDDLSILVLAVQKAGLVDVLKGDGPFTVFAPTNAAFQNLLDSNDSWNGLDDIPVDLLKSVLLFHVISGNIMSTDLSDTYVKTNLMGPNDEFISMQVETVGGVQFNGDSNPVTVDIEATNGVVHVIDKVMLPPNVVTLALNNSGFTTLVAALTDSRHTTDFVSILSGDGPFTIFAPTNTAFQSLLDSNDSWNNLGDIPITVMDAVLKYHVIPSANVQADQLTEGDVTTFEGSSIMIDLADGAQIKTTSNQVVNILVGDATNDVQGTNGVIHAIDMVLLPSS
ncbi:fasciclin domain-containing protein [Lutibacter citreus]|uniref:fasciclin domain-containing protein n=1 Tax=Lutibacter citreus TaxID=2138210 RepID=UPI000DBE95D7|nr:fasciclin domain-containing protein [Lutibacter citreus]